MIYPHAISWKARTGVSLRGDSQFAANQDIRGFYQEDRKMIRDGKGEEIVSEALILFPLKHPVKEGDFLVYKGKSYEVKKADEVSDGVGTPHHLEVRL